MQMVVSTRKYTASAFTYSRNCEVQNEWIGYIVSQRLSKSNSVGVFHCFCSDYVGNTWSEKDTEHNHMTRTTLTSRLYN